MTYLDNWIAGRRLQEGTDTNWEWRKEYCQNFFCL